MLLGWAVPLAVQGGQSCGGPYCKLKIPRPDFPGLGWGRLACKETEIRARSAITGNLPLWLWVDFPEKKTKAKWPSLSLPSRS